MWHVLPFPRFFEHVLLALCALVAAWPLVRWRGWSWALALASLWLGGLAVFGGPMPVLAVAVLAATAVAIGSLLLPGLIALPVGLGLIAGVLGWLLPVQIHYRAVYAVACTALISWRRAEVIATWRSARAQFEDAVARIPEACGCRHVAARTRQHGRMAADHAIRRCRLSPWLALQLQETAHYLPDPVVQVWALAPWAGESCRASPRCWLVAKRAAR